MLTTLAAVALVSTMQPMCSPDLPRPGLFEVTAYTNSRDEVWPHFDGLTASMIPARAELGLVAVDPTVIPLFSRVWIEGLGFYLAADTGGAIKGRRLDVLVVSKRVARTYGRQHDRIVLVWPAVEQRAVVRDVYRDALQLAEVK